MKYPQFCPRFKLTFLNVYNIGAFVFLPCHRSRDLCLPTGLLHNLILALIHAYSNTRPTLLLKIDLLKKLRDLQRSLLMNGRNLPKRQAACRYGSKWWKFAQCGVWSHPRGLFLIVFVAVFQQTVKENFNQNIDKLYTRD